jgi:coenzyme PQQ synthesis protein D (PqqD)
LSELPRPDLDDIRTATLTVPDHVVHRSFEAETLLLNLETGQYHGLNPTGGRLLDLLQENGGKVGAATERLADEYGMQHAEIENEMLSFCADLAERGLIQVDQEAESGSGDR